MWHVSVVRSYCFSPNVWHLFLPWAFAPTHLLPSFLLCFEIGSSAYALPYVWLGCVGSDEASEWQLSPMIHQMFVLLLYKWLHEWRRLHHRLFCLDLTSCARSECLPSAYRFGRAKGWNGTSEDCFCEEGQVENVSLQILFTLTGSFRSSNQLVLKNVKTISIHFCFFLARQLHFVGKCLACTIQKGIYVYIDYIWLCIHTYICVCVMSIMYMRPGSQRKVEMFRACVVLSKIPHAKIAMTQLFLPIEHFESVFVTMFRSKAVAFGLWLL